LNFNMMWITNKTRISNGKLPSQTVCAHLKLF
jgi:hypothetical protein